MTLMFFLSLFSIILARTVNCVIASKSLKNGTLFDGILAFFEFYTIKQLYIIHKSSLIKPTMELQAVQLYEAIFESFLQIIFQSVFIIRTFGDDNDNDYRNIFKFSNGLVLFSIFWSIMSAANKYGAIDTSLLFETDIVENAKIKIKLKCEKDQCSVSLISIITYEFYGVTANALYY